MTNRQQGHSHRREHRQVKHVLSSAHAPASVCARRSMHEHSACRRPTSARTARAHVGSCMHTPKAPRTACAHAETSADAYCRCNAHMCIPSTASPRHSRFNRAEKNAHLPGRGACVAISFALEWFRPVWLTLLAPRSREEYAGQMVD